MAAKKSAKKSAKKTSKKSGSPGTSKPAKNPEEKQGYSKRPGRAGLPANIVSMAEVARLAGVRQSAVTKAGLPCVPDSNGRRYDIEDPDVAAYIEGGRMANRRQRLQKKIKSSSRPQDEKQVEVRISDDLKAIIDSVQDPLAKLNLIHEAEKVEWTRQRRIKVELENTSRKKQMIPVNVMRVWVGAFVPGIRNNFLPLPQRIARGNKELEARAAKEVETGIRKTIESALALLKDSDSIDNALAEDLMLHAEEDE